MLVNLCQYLTLDHLHHHPMALGSADCALDGIVPLTALIGVDRERVVELFKEVLPGVCIDIELDVIELQSCRVVAP